MTSSSAVIQGAAFLAAALAFSGLALLLPLAFRRYQAQLHGVAGATRQPRFSRLSTAQLSVCGVLLGVLSAGIALLWLPWPLAAGIGLAALATPRLLINHRRKRRERLLVRQLPDALQALAASLQAGSNLARGLELISRRQPRPLAEEFALIIQRQRLGEDLERILDDLHQRVPCEEIGLFRSAVLIAQQVGGDLAGTLEILAMTLRERAAVEDRIQALTAMGRMQGRVMALLPPGIAGMLYLQQPALMGRLFTDPLGQAVLALAGGMTGLAIILIRRIVRIDV
mgnify:CR=1 FL=1